MSRSFNKKVSLPYLYGPIVQNTAFRPLKQQLFRRSALFRPKGVLRARDRLRSTSGGKCKRTRKVGRCERAHTRAHAVAKFLCETTKPSGGYSHDPRMMSGASALADRSTRRRDFHMPDSSAVCSKPAVKTTTEMSGADGGDDNDGPQRLRSRLGAGVTALSTRVEHAELE
ncbi:hypothetical protein TcWFU_004745 [Taenia crassiceps]|uniref:Uncharacterized protein n=1 Tax=Taenia crassiceps TaxID=6207 RepID=A0ABR4QDQ8_9CEST